MTSLDLSFFVIALFLSTMTLVFNRVMRKRWEARQRSLEFQKFDSYLENLNRILRQNPSYTKAYWYKARIYETMGRLDESRRYDRIANALSPRIATSGDYADDTPPVVLSTAP
jgi:tetratricopeptide (TPR) repeat protein